jgi:hypothetical protein
MFQQFVRCSAKRPLTHQTVHFHSNGLQYLWGMPLAVRGCGLWLCRCRLIGGIRAGHCGMVSNPLGAAPLFVGGPTGEELDVDLTMRPKSWSLVIKESTVASSLHVCEAVVS